MYFRGTNHGTNKLTMHLMITSQLLIIKQRNKVRQQARFCLKSAAQHPCQSSRFQAGARLFVWQTLILDASGTVFLLLLNTVFHLYRTAQQLIL